MKLKSSQILALFLLLTTLFTTGCAGSFFAEETLQIASIESELLESGETKITITYTDEEITPHVFYIPAGKEGVIGADGNGIQGISYERDENGHQTKVILSFTDETMDDFTFAVPDGLSIIGIEDDVDVVTGNTYIVFRYSNDTLSDPIYLPKGDKGNGIKSYTPKVNEDKSINLDFVFDDGRELNIVIPPPQDGNGIASMSTSEDKENKKYLLTVNYTNGTSETLEWNRPADPNQWLYGSDPEKALNSRDGDYFFDTFHKIIYIKENGSWNQIVDFNTFVEECKITFNLNDNDEDTEHKAGMPTGAKQTYMVLKGTYFSAEENGKHDIPVPERTGYKFVGWYTKSSVNPATMSAFTDLTPVLSDLTLYAIWEKIA